MRRELILNFHGLGTPHSGVGADEEPFWLSRRTFVAMIDRIAFMGEDAGAPTSITFDDGNTSDATIALPELVKRGLTATFFVCADRIGMPHYLDRNAIGDLLQAGMAIGSHGMRHCDWRKLDDGALDDEIRRSARANRRCLRQAGADGIDSIRVVRPSRCSRDCGGRHRFVHTSDGGLARSGAWLKPRQSLDVRCSARDLERVRRRLAVSAAAAPRGYVLQGFALAVANRKIRGLRQHVVAGMSRRRSRR